MQLNITLDKVLFTQVLLSTLIPYLVGWVTTKNVPSWVKRGILWGLTALGAILGQVLVAWQAGHVADIGLIVLTYLASVGMAETSYQSVIKPTNRMRHAHGRNKTT